MGGGARLGAITISSANDVTAVAITAASLVQTTGSGTTTFNGAQDYSTAAGLNVVADTIVLNGSVVTDTNGTQNGIVTLNADRNNGGAGTLTIGGGGDIYSGGAVSLTGNQGILTGGDVSTTGAAVSYASATTLTGNVLVDATNSGGSPAGANITFGSDIAGAGFNLDVTTGAGDVSVTGAVGSDSAVLGNLTIASNGTVTFNGTLDIGGFSQTGTGSTTLNANLETGASFSFTGTGLTFAAGSGDNVVGGDMTINNGGTFTLAPGATLASAGIFEQTGAGAVRLGGDVSSADAMTFSSAVQLTDDVTLQNTAGAIELASTVDGEVGGVGHGLIISGAGAVTLGNKVGSLVALTSVSITGTTITIDGPIAGTSVRTTGTQQYSGAVNLGKNTTLTGSTMTMNGTVTGGGNSLAINGAVGFGGGNVVFNNVVSGLSSLSVVNATTINTAAITTTGVQTYSGPVTLGADTVLTTTDSTITFAGTLTDGVGSFNLELNAGNGGAIAFTGVNAAGAVTINDLTITQALSATFSGNVTLNSLITTANAYSVALNGATTTVTTGTTFLNSGGVVLGNGGDVLTFTGGLDTTAGATSVGGTVRTGGQQIDLGAVTLTAASTVDSSNNGGSPAGANINFASTIQNSSARALAVNAGTGGTVTFENTVGAGTALASLTVNGNSTAINGGSVRTSGNQSYSGAVTLGAATTLTTTANGNIAFTSTIRNATARALTLTAGTGTVTFGGAVGGGGTALSSLAVTGGTIAINGGSMTTSGAGGQTYTGAVAAGAVTFDAGSSGNIDLSNAANDFTGVVTIANANGVTLQDANALAIGATSTTGGQVFVAAGNITSTGVKVATGSNLLLQSTEGGVTLSAGSTYSSSLTQVVVGRGQSFINNVSASDFTGTAQIFTDRASLNSPSTPDAGLSSFDPAFNVTPVVTLSATPGSYTLSNSTGPLPAGDVVAYLPILPEAEVLTAAEVNQILTTDANLTSIPVASGALGIFLPSLDPVSFGAILPAKPAASGSGGGAPIRISFRGEQEKEL
ncbi:S-layer family protein [bacterium]|nr:S-layer family protein [bacterium]